MKNLFIYLATLFLVTIPSAVYGCSCAYSAPAMAFNDSKVVFIGKMTGGTEKNTLQERDGSSYEIESGEVTFEVGESFKGKPGKTVTIQIASMKGTSCGTYGLRRGETYVVYAYAYKPDMLSSGVCTRTGTVSQAKEDVAFLRSLPPGGSGGTITGRVSLDTKAITGGGARPLGGVSVRITGPMQKTVTVLTDKEGKFEASGLPEGKYKVAPKFPPNYYSDQGIDEVTLSDLGTVSTRFEAYYKGRVLGQVFDADGVPFNDGFFNLGNSTHSTYGHSMGKDGRFEVEGVPPGEYKLYIDTYDNNDKVREYYYPGTYDPAKAGIIKIALGETKSGLRFYLSEGIPCADHKRSGTLGRRDPRREGRGVIALSAKPEARRIYRGDCSAKRRNRQERPIYDRSYRRSGLLAGGPGQKRRGIFSFTWAEDHGEHEYTE